MAQSDTATATPSAIVMPISYKLLERLTFCTLFLLIATAIYYWEMVEAAHKKTFNALGVAHLHRPTADLFLWICASFILYFLTRIWGRIAGRVFELPDDRTRAWRIRLLAVRVLTTFTFLALTIRTISTHVPDYLQKLPKFPWS